MSDALNTDFYAYGMIDIIDKRLSTIPTRIIKKDWPGAMAHLEALTHSAGMESIWGWGSECRSSAFNIYADIASTVADDGKRLRRTARASSPPSAR